MLNRGGSRDGRGRMPSGPWGRLKPVDQDPLESMGLPSKGDTRLLDHKTQERFYLKIVERYMTFCSDAGERDELIRRFSSISLSDVPTLVSSSSMSNPDSSTVLGNTKALSDVLGALRKLREGIVASNRADEFAVQAYLFCIRLAILVRNPTTYHPAILYFLRTFPQQGTVTSVELHEVAVYLVLDAACRRGELAEACEARKRWGLRDAKVDAALRALAHDNYVSFERVRRSVDGHRAKLMEFAGDEIRTVALKCFGRAYLTIDVDFLERCTGESWENLKGRHGVGWELEGTRVVIRRVKGK